MSWIEIDLKDIDTQELIDELEDRYLDKQEMEQIAYIVHHNDNFIIFNAVDKTKFDIIKQLIDKYSIIELQEILKEQIIDTKTLELFT